MATAASVEQMLAQQEELRKKQSQQTTDSTAAQEDTVVEEEFDTETNTFFKIFDSTDTADEKRAKLIAALTYDRAKSKEQNKAIQQEFVDFKKFLQRNRLDLHREMITLTDPNTVAELSDLFDKMFGGIKEYEDRMKWMNDILTAVFELRTKGGADLQAGVYNEIETDKKAAAQRLTDIAQTEADIKAVETKVARESEEIESLKKKKKFFIFGRPSKATLDAIAERQVALDEATEEKEQKEASLKTLQETPIAETKYASFSQQKEIVRKMLAIPREDHVKNSEELIQSALKFIDDSRKGGLTALQSLNKLEGRIEQQDENNNDLRNIYGALADASGEAAKANQLIAKEVEVAPEGETLPNQLKREDEARSIQGFIDVANTTAVDTIEVVGELGKESVNVMTMKNTLSELKEDVDKQTSSGIATVAGGIATSLTAFNQAVINESAKTVEGAAKKMNKTTDLTNASQAVQQAINVGKQADELKEALDAQADTLKLLEFVKSTKKEGMGRVKDVTAEMVKLNNQFRERLNEVKSVGTDLDMQDSKGELAGKFDAAATPTNDNAGESVKVPKPAAKKGGLGLKGLGG